MVDGSRRGVNQGVTRAKEMEMYLSVPSLGKMEGKFFAATIGAFVTCLVVSCLLSVDGLDGFLTDSAPSPSTSSRHSQRSLSTSFRHSQSVTLSMFRTRRAAAVTAASEISNKRPYDVYEYEQIGYNVYEDEESNDDQEDDEDDEETQLLETLDFKATFLNKAFQAYQLAFDTSKTEIKEAIPSILQLWEVIEAITLDFADGLQNILESSEPPTLDELKDLPEWSSIDPKRFCVYLLIFEKAERECRPLIYVGTGTDKDRGTHARFNDYAKSKNFSRYFGEARERGYNLTHKKIMVSANLPESNMILPARALFRMIETSLSYGLYGILRQ